MITASGIHIQTIGGADGTPTAEDIALHAGRLCRFGGAVWYPLLPHLVFVGLLAYRRSHRIEDLMWGFLHDAHETVTCDVPQPFKCDCMRKEQKAIDDRIMKKYMNGLLINLDLIKECDLIACDVEALTLNLPNYSEITLANRKVYGGKSELHSDPEDFDIFYRIMASPFGAVNISPNNFGVRMFSEALLLMESDNRTAFVEKIEDWRLL